MVTIELRAQNLPVSSTAVELSIEFLTLKTLGLSGKILLTIPFSIYRFLQIHIIVLRQTDSYKFTLLF